MSTGIQAAPHVGYSRGVQEDSEERETSEMDILEDEDHETGRHAKKNYLAATGSHIGAIPAVVGIFLLLVLVLTGIAIRCLLVNNGTQLEGLAKISNAKLLPPADKPVTIYSGPKDDVTTVKIQTTTTKKVFPELLLTTDKPTTTYTEPKDDVTTVKIQTTTKKVFPEFLPTTGKPTTTYTDPKDDITTVIIKTTTTKKVFPELLLTTDKPTTTYTDPKDDVTTVIIETTTKKVFPELLPTMDKPTTTYTEPKDDVTTVKIQTTTKKVPPPTVQRRRIENHYHVTTVKIQTTTKKGNRCPEGWLKVGCNCYYELTESSGLQRNTAYCQRHGGTVMIVNSREKQRILRGETSEALQCG